MGETWFPGHEWFCFFSRGAMGEWFGFLSRITMGDFDVHRASGSCQYFHELGESGSPPTEADARV